MRASRLMLPAKARAWWMGRVLWLLLPALAAAQTATLTVDAAKPLHPVSPMLWGIFFEDINLSADGGIYPELVRNRSFEDGDQPEHWKLAADNEGESSMSIDLSKPLNAFNPRSLRVKVNGSVALENEGYWGMNVVKGDDYTLKLAARAQDGFTGPLIARLLDAAGKELARGSLSGLDSDWKYHTLRLTPADSDSAARLQLQVSGQGTLFLDMVSLMPNKTWKGSELRPDLAEALDALKPSFLRFPGGCWVEGEDRAHMYNWKNTVGDLDARPSLYNLWGYTATHGLGFHEYLQTAENLGAEPLFVLNCGMSHKQSVEMDQMALWVRDALDAIEYANGPTNTYWGGLRAKAGHAAPFGLKYLEIGNENGGAAYRERWPLFVNAIKAEHPEIQLIANFWQGGYPQEPRPEIVDEHYYDTPEFFMTQADRYDLYDRKGPKIFVGEYAVTRGGGKGNLRAAIGEAAFMTGLERNSDIVAMACYAPLFAHVKFRKWAPDLINFDNSRWYGLPGYYVQKLFSENRGDLTLPMVVRSSPAEPVPLVTGIGVGAWNTAAEFKDVKVTAPDGRLLFASDFSRGTNGWEFHGEGEWSVEGGALRQTAEKMFVRAIAGNHAWTNYTLQLKARKISGREGFLILFQTGDADDRVWWNIGGWGNTLDGVEWGVILERKPRLVEVGRWYDIRVEVSGNRARCWLDDQLVHDVRKPGSGVRALYASATRDEKSGDIILKVVNTAAEPTVTEVRLDGVEKLSGSAQATVLTSDDPRDENSLDQPARVVPKTDTLPIPGARFTHAFPANSFTVLRVGAGK